MRVLSTHGGRPGRGPDVGALSRLGSGGTHRWLRRDWGSLSHRKGAAVEAAEDGARPPPRASSTEGRRPATQLPGSGRVGLCRVLTGRGSCVLTRTPVCPEALCPKVRSRVAPAPVGLSPDFGTRVRVAAWWPQGQRYPQKTEPPAGRLHVFYWQLAVGTAVRTSQLCVSSVSRVSFR